MSQPLAFRARIYRVGILRCVNLPERVGRHFARWRNAPVRIAIGDHTRTTRLTGRAGGGFRVFIDGRLRKAAGVDTGDDVQLRIALDPSIDHEPFPDDVLDVADGVDGGLQALMLLPPGLKRQILKFLGEAKSPAARTRRLRRLADLLNERSGT